MPAFEIRPATPADADQIAAIYAPIVRDTAISFETEPPSPTEMAQRITTTLETHPWLTAADGSTVLGYAYASAHRARAAYRWSVDVTVYIAEPARGHGVGRALYGALLPTLKAQGFRSAFAGIALPNAGSVALHEAVGFKPLGVYEQVGFKLGAWRDVGWWQATLSDGVGVPAEPVPFPRLSAEG